MVAQVGNFVSSTIRFVSNHMPATVAAAAFLLPAVVDRVMPNVLLSLAIGVTVDMVHRHIYSPIFDVTAAAATAVAEHAINHPIADGAEREGLAPYVMREIRAMISTMTAGAAVAVAFQIACLLRSALLDGTSSYQFRRTVSDFPFAIGLGVSISSVYYLAKKAARAGGEGITAIATTAATGGQALRAQVASSLRQRRRLPRTTETV